MSDADPGITTSIREWLAQAGFPCPDDLPDHLVEAVAGAWQDRARLDWTERRKPEIAPVFYSWRVSWPGDHREPRDTVVDGLRAAIDAARRTDDER